MYVILMENMTFREAVGIPCIGSSQCLNEGDALYNYGTIRVDFMRA
jgi:hypothetical protein